MTQMNYTDKKKPTRVAIISNGKYQSKRIAGKLFAIFKDADDFYLTKRDPDVVISIGGDGMLLSAFHIREGSRPCAFCRHSHRAFGFLHGLS